MSDITRTMTPEERELEDKRAQLVELEAGLAQQELDLATLYGELQAFEARYLRVVGIRYAELDEIAALLAEAEARRHPQDDQFQHRAREAQERARSSTGAAEETNGPDDFKPTRALRDLYRQVAKCVHPDLAANGQECPRRNRLMVEANRAYGEGDEESLRAILNEWQSAPESVKGEGTGADLVRVIRQIAQVRRRLEEIERDTALLMGSELYELSQKAAAAEKKGRDLLRDMAQTLDIQITTARAHLDRATVEA